MKRLDARKQEFGRLTVVGTAPVTLLGKTYWECRCTCGGMRLVQLGNLRSGNTTSCGCRAREVTAARHAAARTQRLVEVVTAEPMPGWWNLGARRDWFITAACGHHVLRRGRAAAEDPLRGVPNVLNPC